MKPAKISGRTQPVTVLDVGGNKITCLIAQISEQGQMQVLGVGHQLSKGIRGGIISDVGEAETSIIAAMHAAEEMAGVTIETALVSVTLPQLHSRHVRVELALGHEAVSDRELMDIIREGRSSITSEEYLLHCLPFNYALDDYRGIQDPRGMLGEKLIADLLVVTVPHNLLRNLNHCINRCHLEVSDFVAAPYASALACIEEDEKDLGCLMIDLGGTVTGYAVYSAGRLVHLGSLPMGCQHITHDIAVGLSTSMQAAERLKTMQGSAVISPADDQAMIDVPRLGDDEEETNHVPRSALNHIIRPRLEEIFEMVRIRLEEAGIQKLAGNRVILTGGGSQLIGINDLAARILGKQIRSGKPRQAIEGLADAVSGPAFSTPVGMLQYAILLQTRWKWLHRPQNFSLRNPLANLFGWIKENF